MKGLTEAARLACSPAQLIPGRLSVASCTCWVVLNTVSQEDSGPAGSRALPGEGPWVQRALAGGQQVLG